MQFAKYSVVAPGDWLVWWLPLALVSVAVPLLIVVNAGHLPYGAAFTLLAAVAVYWTVFAIRTMDRFVFQESIAYYDRDFGLGVCVTEGVTKDQAYALSEAVNLACADVAKWLKRFNGALSPLLLDGYYLDIVAGESFYDGFTGRKITGLSRYNTITVAFSGPTGVARFQDTLSHEIGHSIYTNMGVLGEEAQHEAMRKDGFPWA